jgi:glycosyltransferase involved in cell wall biosynthesis
MAHLSIVVPVYLAESCLVFLYERVVEAVAAIDPHFELILVDDCSPDDSWRVIEALGARDRRVKGIRFARNFGQQIAMTAGLRASGGDWVVMMDCDLQDLPEDIPTLYRAVQTGFDMVIARRTYRTRSRARIMLTEIFYMVLSLLMRREFDPHEGSFRIMSRRLVAHFNRFTETDRLFNELTRWLGFPTAIVDVKHSTSLRGKSSYTLSKLLRLAFDIVLVHSDRVLRTVMLAGLVTSGGAVALGLYILVNALTHPSPIYGWSSIMVSSSFFSGAIISMIALLGLHVGKLHDAIRARPLFVVREQLNLRAAGAVMAVEDRPTDTWPRRSELRPEDA